MIDIAILIPSLEDRGQYLKNLLLVIDKQGRDNSINYTCLIDTDAGEARLGAKRNTLISRAVRAGARYVAFFDDDDLPGPTYLKDYMAAVNAGADVCELRGQIYFGGRPGKPFLHSLKYKSWYEDKNFYYRCPNHLNLVRLELVKGIAYKEIDFGEDGQWSYEVRDKGVLKVEQPNESIIYHYFTGDKGHAAEAYGARLKSLLE